MPTKWLVFGIGYGRRFFQFWDPKWFQNGFKISPKSSKWCEHHWQKEFWETTCIQNDPKWSQGLQKYPQTTPGAPKTTPKRSPELKKRCPNDPQSFKTDPKRALELQKPRPNIQKVFWPVQRRRSAKTSSDYQSVTPYFVLCSFHFALFTLHFHLHSIQPGGLREAIK